MSGNARIFLYVVGGLALIAGLFGLANGVPVFPLIVAGAVVLVGTMFDIGYRGDAKPNGVVGGSWQLTGEREIDSLTGEARQVWFDPITGARRYEPLGSDPNCK